MWSNMDLYVYIWNDPARKLVAGLISDKYVHV